jgi:hypothetical protein
VRKTRAAKYFGWTILAATFWALTFFPLCVAESSKNQPAGKTSGGVSVAHSDFHGWKAIVLRNRAAEILIVPDIGRVMEFNLLDDAGRTVPGPFWNNPALDTNMPADVEGWRNYGGDKAWPAPQSEWPKIAGRGWPPPNGFDVVPFAATITATKKGRQVQLVSPVDSRYGVRIRRTISLDSQKPLVTIRTVYEKVRGTPVRMSVWTITQLASPDRAFILLPAHSKFPQGYINSIPPPPRDLRVDGRLLSVGRDLSHKVKIGSDGDALLWVGSGADLLLESKASDPDGDQPDANKADWPEQGSHSQIYTSPGEQMKYVEFELLDRLRDLKPGQKASLEAVYTLISRTQSDSAAEAKKVFQQP